MWFFLFFKQTTAYELRISDWSSDVCSSDLQAVCLPPIAEQGCPHAVTIFIEARDAPIESTAHIILERYVTCRTGNIDRSAARCDLGHTGRADRAYVVGGRERGSHNRAGRRDRKTTRLN